MPIDSRSRVEDILNVILGNLDPSVLQPPQSRVEDLLQKLNEMISDFDGKIPVHICTYDEYDHETLMPTIEDPDEDTFYLVPANDSGDDMYIEWIFTETNRWERFGSGGGSVVIEQSDWNQNDSSQADFIKNKPDLTLKLDKNQGAANVGKLMGVDSSGNVVPLNAEGGPVISVAGKTGAVVLDGNDVAFNEAATYNDGTIGGTVADLKSATDHILFFEKQNMSEYIPSLCYQRGSLNNNGTVTTTNKERIYTPEKLIFDKELVINYLDPLYRLTIIIYSGDSISTYNITPTGTAAGTNQVPFIIPQNTYFKIGIRLVTETGTIANIDTFSEAFKFYISDKATSVEQDLSKIDEVVLKGIQYQKYVRGWFNNQTGAVQANNKRIITNNIFTADRDILITSVATGFDVYVINYTDAVGTALNVSRPTGSKQAGYVIKKGDYYRVGIKRTTENNYEYADISDFSTKFSYKSVYEDTTDAFIENDKEVKSGTITRSISINTVTSEYMLKFERKFNKGTVIDFSFTADNVGTGNVVYYCYTTDYVVTGGKNETVRCILQTDLDELMVRIPANTLTASGNLTVSATFVGIANRMYCVEHRYTIQDEVPAYYFENDYLPNKIARINTLAKGAFGNGDAFVSITDAHWNPNYNARKAPNLLSYIWRNTHIPRLFDCGDTGDGGNDEYVERLRNAFPGELHFAMGNHEFTGNTSPSELAYRFDAYSENQIGSKLNHYYYVDNRQSKIRYIVLCTNGIGFNQEQLDWVANDALDVETGWLIIVFCHYLYVIDWDTDVLSQTSAGISMTSVLDNYSGDGKIIAVFNGHSHRDRITHTPGGIPVILSAADKYVPTYGTWTTADVTVTRTKGTITEQSFDCVIVNRDEKTITMVRIGGKAENGIDNSRGEQVEERSVTWM